MQRILLYHIYNMSVKANLLHVLKNGKRRQNRCETGVFRRHIGAIMRHTGMLRRHTGACAEASYRFA